MQQPQQPQPISHIARVGGSYIYTEDNHVVENLQASIAKESPAKLTNGTYGFRSSQLQALYTNFYASNLSSYDVPHQVYFAYKIMKLESIEEKRIGIMILTKNIDDLTVKHVDDFERIYDHDINEWTICDNFAVKVLSQLIKKNDQFADRISQWKDCGKLWRLRAVCVAFVTMAKVGGMTDLCFTICSSCVKSSERFVQLGVGCLLREMSINMSDKVVEFIKDHYRYFIREGLRYSIDKLDPKVRKDILSIGKKRKNKSNDDQQSVIQQQPQQQVMSYSMYPQPNQQFYVDMSYYDHNDIDVMYDMQLQNASINPNNDATQSQM